MNDESKDAGIFSCFPAFLIQNFPLRPAVLMVKCAGIYEKNNSNLLRCGHAFLFHRLPDAGRASATFARPQAAEAHERDAKGAGAGPKIESIS
jgi:hypothetical protein